MAGVHWTVGELEASKHHFIASLAAYDDDNPQRSALGSDLGVFGHAWYSHTLWLLGEDDVAVQHADQALALAERRDHKYSQALALTYQALLQQMRLDPVRALASAEAAVEFCERYEFGYYDDCARVVIGWARGCQAPAEGVRIIEAALESLDRHRAQARRPYYLSLLAETYDRLGERDRAVLMVDRALGLAQERGDNWWLPAIYLQKAAFGRGPERDGWLEQALTLARRQASRNLERRILAAVSRTPARTLSERSAS
jgi:adenylate cyclase